ncbi:MAG: sigma-E factor negative regulatory protein [Xanthomonadales bacterium]|nr:sigma-E factor negative regulatory protein [Xanthomonadales bacterium]
MSDKSNQNISELMDGELSRDCSKFLLKRMQSDSELRSSWNTYHMLRSCLQKEHDAPLIQNLGIAVLAKIGENDHQEATAVKNTNRWLKGLTGSAIAASVALFAVFSFNNMNQIDQDVNHPNFAKTSKQLINPPNATVVRVEQPVRYSRFPSLTPQVQEYINESNNQPMIPVYYNTDYINNLIIKARTQNTQNQVEE